MHSSHYLILMMLQFHWKPTKHQLLTRRKGTAIEMPESMEIELETTHQPFYVGD